MTEIEKVTNVDDLFCYIPCIISEICEVFLENNQIPRYPSVFKILKERLGLIGFDYKKLSTYAKSEIELIASDTFYGLKEAGF